jgi:XRE family aerobic/anaerobic benzoate catabolism transcriptional regulator
VLALSGGVVTSPEAWELLRARAFTVWLRARPEDHWNRVIEQGDRRPMDSRPRAMAELRRLLAAREPLYARADLSVDTSRQGVSGSVRAIAARVNRSPVRDRRMKRTTRTTPQRRRDTETL